MAKAAGMVGTTAVVSQQHPEHPEQQEQHIAGRSGKKTKVEPADSASEMIQPGHTAGAGAAGNCPSAPEQLMEEVNKAVPLLDPEQRLRSNVLFLEDIGMYCLP